MSQDPRESETEQQRRAVSLVADDRGAVLIWTVLIALPTFFALGALAVDALRTYNTFDEAQSFADHTALAAARELNGRAGAIDRAIKAACGPNPGPLVTGSHTYGQAKGGNRALATGQLVFLSALGDDPTRPAGDVEICRTTCGGGCGGADDAAARFVEVTTAPVTVSWLLAPMMNAFGVNLGDTADAAARATAGSPEMEVCAWPPLYICNPPGNLTPGMQIWAKSKDNWFPGGRGYTEPPPGGQGPQRWADAFRFINRIDQCTDNSVGFDDDHDTQPGAQVAQTVVDAFNERFCPGDPESTLDPCFKTTSLNCAFPASEYPKRFGTGNQCAGFASCYAQYVSQRSQSTCTDWIPPAGYPLDRREHVLAVIDCTGLTGNEDNVTVVGYIKAFQTHKNLQGGPQGARQDTFMEYLEPANAETLPEFFKEYPVLYR